MLTRPDLQPDAAVMQDEMLTPSPKGLLVKRVVSSYLDKTVLYPKTRWLFLTVLLTSFAVRIVTYQGFYIFAYALSIYLLNLFLGFLTPKIDPEEEEGYILPVRTTDEFRPFQRRVDEFHFWLRATQATLVSLFFTLFPILDLPVFWPVLLVYFIFLFIVTMRQQIKHMIKHKYIPFSWGKQSYGDVSRGWPYSQGKNVLSSKKPVVGFSAQKKKPSNPFYGRFH